MTKRQIIESCRITKTEDNDGERCCSNGNGSGLAGEDYDQPPTKGNVCATLIEEKCPICNDFLHTFQLFRQGSTQTITGTRLLNCDQFYNARDDKKRELFSMVKARFGSLCKYCTGWGHNSSDCRVKGTCQNCNFSHVKGACCLQSL